MRRRLFSILACLSLVLSVAALVLWVRGRFVDDTFGVSRHVFDGEVTQYRAVEIGSGQNTLGIAYRIAVLPVFGDAKLPTPEVSWYTGLHHSNPAKETTPFWARDVFYSGEAWVLAVRREHLFVARASCPWLALRREHRSYSTDTSKSAALFARHWNSPQITAETQIERKTSASAFIGVHQRFILFAQAIE